MTSTTSTDQQSQSATEQAKERVQEVAQQAKGETRERLRSQLNERSTQVGEQTSSTAKAMRRAGEQLRREGNERAAGMLEAVADRGERLGGYLRRADGDQLLRDVEDFARRQPWLMVGGSAIVGFLASRFMKASSSGRYHGRGSTSGYPSREVDAGAASRAALPVGETRLGEPGGVSASERGHGQGGRPE